MAYDEELAWRIRAALGGLDAAATEKKMFGGLAFLVNGNMAVAASGQGGLLLRVPPEQTETLVAEAHVERFSMRGREMDGWLHIAPQAAEGDEALRRWVAIGADYARALPPKQK